jgi:acyl-CoA hydrolase
VAACARTFSLRDTLLESYHIVASSLVNALGVMHGGNTLRLIVDQASAVASRISQGYALLAGIDFVYLASPAREGETLALRSWATYSGRSSVEIVARIDSLGLAGASEYERLVALAHMTFVAVDGSLRPRPHGACIKPRGPDEEAQHEASARLRGERESRLARRREEPFDVSPPAPAKGGATGSTVKIVNPADSIAYNVMHAGSMLFLIDELAAVIAARQAGGVVVTGFVGPADFYRPIPVGYVLEAHGASTYAGRSTVEVDVKVLGGPMAGEWRETVARAYLALVHLGPDGRPAPIPEARRLSPAEGAEERAEWRRRVIGEVESGALAFQPPKRG